MVPIKKEGLNSYKFAENKFLSHEKLIMSYIKENKSKENDIKKNKF